MSYLYKNNLMLTQKIRFAILLLLLPCFTFSQTKDSTVYKIGQMIMVGLSGTSADTSSNFYKDIKDGKVGGVSIYEANLTQTNAAENLRSIINTYQSASPIPLFTAITQEGGLVNRLKTKYGFTPMPSAEYLGKLDNLDSTKYYGDNIAFTLSRLGINLNFAPVVDVYMPTNPVLGSRERTFSANTDVIVKHAGQIILSHNYFKVNTVLKHFPGHGSSTTDSHLGLTDVSKTWKQEELKPYRELIKKGLVKAVMTAHIVNENLDRNKLPATLSKKVITDLLRKDLKFNGVVFSDDMNMKAISAEYGLKESIEMSINAGVDVLLFSGKINGVTPNGATDIVNIILRLMKEGKISKERINASYGRIIKMKAERNNL
jgi:beta-N-acetylhexosaminidase